MAMGHECFQTMVPSWFCVAITCPIHEIFGCFKFPEWMTQRGSNGSKDLDMHPAHRNLYPFLALLCVRACDSPKRSAPAAVFTCRSLAIAAFYLVVALWNMENWQDILRIFIVRFVLCIWKGFVWQFESIFKLLPQTIQGPDLSGVGMSLPSISLQPSDLAIERLWTNKKNQKCITRNKAWTIPWPG